MPRPSATSPGAPTGVGVLGAVRAFGAWLHPATAYRRKSHPEQQLQVRAGIVGLFCALTGAVALALAIWYSAIANPLISPARETLAPNTLVAGAALVLISVFAPQAIFRTRSASHTRGILKNPTTPLRPWRSSTISFDAVLVGAMLAGLYYSASVMLTFFGLALVAKVAFTNRQALDRDPNARFHGLVEAWTSGVTAITAYLIVSPLAITVELSNSALPLVLAGLVAMYLGLAFNAVERWVSATHEPWAFARDAIDIRRIVVALVSAGLAWFVSMTGDFVGGITPVESDLNGSLAGAGAFVLGWLLLWYASILMWRREATRTMDLWSAHQAEIVTRLADGSFSPELAGRAALPTTARMALVVFGATRALATVEQADGSRSSSFAAIARYENSPVVDATALAAHPHMHMQCSALVGQTSATGVTISSWLWPGWFMTRSRGIVDRFTQLATSTLLLPVIASAEDTEHDAFRRMFDEIHRWPNLAAFEQAVDRMRARADASPNSDSLIIGVLAIDDFGALSGGRFEQAAVTQVMRMAQGHPEFAGHDLFVAYEAPGRLWLALAGGPIIRTGISLLRGLQDRINEQGSVSAAKLDLDVHVSVSFGYGVHQVDDFSREGLMATALERLAIDAGSRHPFELDSLFTYDIRPEDIIGANETPITAIDVATRLRSDAEGRPDAFPVSLAPVTNVDTGETIALRLRMGWDFSIGHVDLRDPDAFASLVNRQPELAAIAATRALHAAASLLDEADNLGYSSLMLLVDQPAILLHPEAAQHSLPNLLGRTLDRRHASRTVVLVDTVPPRSGEALRLLADRGSHVAVTAAAAAGADAADLFGWSRWAVVFPPSLLHGPAGPDSLTIQQTVSAIAGFDTRLIGIVADHVDRRELAKHRITWTIHPSQTFDSVAASLTDLGTHEPLR